MRRWLCILLAAVAMCLVTALGETCGDYRYEVNEDGCAI